MQNNERDERTADTQNQDVPESNTPNRAPATANTRVPRNTAPRADRRTERERARTDSANARAEEAERRLAAERRARTVKEEQRRDREARRQEKAAYREEHPGFYDPNLRIHSVIVIALSLLALFVAIAFILQEQVGAIGAGIACGLLGCFSTAAWLIPIFMLIHAILWHKDVANRTLVPKAIAFIPVLIMTSALLAIASSTFNPNEFDIKTVFDSGCRFIGGGAVGGAVGYFLHSMIGVAGTVLLAVVVYVFFICLYGKSLIVAGYNRARIWLKETKEERAKEREVRRTEKRREKKELATVRREEKHKRKIESIQRKGREAEEKKNRPAQIPSPVTEAPITEEPIPTPSPRNGEKTVPVGTTPAGAFNARERVTFSTPEKRQPMTEPRTSAPVPAPAPVQKQVPKTPVQPVSKRLPEAEREEARREKIERRRSLFLDFEQDEEPEPKTPNATEAVDPRTGMSEAHISRAVTYDAEDIAPHGAIPRSGMSAGQALAADPMRTPASELDLSGDKLAIASGTSLALKAVEYDTPTTEEKAPQEPKKPAAGTSFLGKLLRRTFKERDAEAAARAKWESAPTPTRSEESAPVQEKPTPAPQDNGDENEENGLDYFRSITVNAGERSQVGHDRPFMHPDITPLPPREKPQIRTMGTTPIFAPEEPVDEEDVTDIPVETVTEPSPHGSGIGNNPFHPGNNPAYRTEERSQPKMQYDGRPGTGAFTPTSTLQEDLDAAKQAGIGGETNRTENRTPPSPVPPRTRVVQEKIDMKPKPAPKPYTFPPLSLLTMPEIPDEGNISAEVQTNAEILVTALESFKVRSRVTGYSRGPRITRYEVVPDAGIRVRAIANLVDDITMALASQGVRIEAPIPGKSAVGVEVPNSAPTLVRLRGMLDSDKFRNFSEKTMVCLGSDVAGQPVYCDLAKMPHMLVAGATGMGKSVCINSIITSILYKASPDEVKLIMIDPKKVEFSMYSGIPHLLVPVVIDPKKAAGALSWSVNEMERRFGLLEQAGVRDIKSYNAYVNETGDGEPLARIIIIIDELHDLMMSAKDAVETSIARIAAKARAAGIHLLIGTQRPSVDVITGTIKNNIPSRIAFHVSSQVDSRTILDFAGAEKLLAHGDMLYAPAGMSKPLRVQGSFVDDKEIDRVVSFLKENNEYNSEVGEEIMADIEREAEKCVPQKKNGGEEGGGSNIPTDDDDNHMLWAALEIGFDHGKLATSLLQRKLSIGYSKAAKILDTLQEMGCVSAPDGSKPREILISREEFKEMMARGVREQCGDNFS